MRHTHHCAYYEYGATRVGNSDARGFLLYVIVEDRRGIVLPGVYLHTRIRPTINNSTRDLGVMQIDL